MTTFDALTIRKYVLHSTPDGVTFKTGRGPNVTVEEGSFGPQPLASLYCNKKDSHVT